MIAASILPWWVETVIWAITFLTALRIARFETPVMPGTDPAFVFMTVYLPAGVAAIAALAIALNFGLTFFGKELPTA